MKTKIISILTILALLISILPMANVFAAGNFSITIVGDKIEAAKLYQVAQDINKVTNEIDPQDITNKINSLFQS